MDLINYTPLGDKKNSDFFNEYLPRIYQRRSGAGIDELVGEMAGVVIQVEHCDIMGSRHVGGRQAADSRGAAPGLLPEEDGAPEDP